MGSGGGKLLEGICRGRGLSLYVHVPFCSAKCPYCDFYSLPSPSSDDLSLFLRGLREELRFWRPSHRLRLRTLYLGGGTPSLLPAEILEEVLGAIGEAFELGGWTELSFEVNPDSEGLPVKLWKLKGFGRLRVSVGVQSFREEELSLLGRPHGVEEALEALRACRSTRVDSLGVDLMYALPGQTLGDLLHSLGVACALGLDHISCYELTPHEGTRMGESILRGDLSLPDAEPLYWAICRFLGSRGYLHYEISNFARSSEHRCEHNLSYWRGEVYLGLGPSAGGNLGPFRYRNVSDLRSYAEGWSKGIPPWEEVVHLLDPEDRAFESTMMGLRSSEGVDLVELVSRAGGGLELARRLLGAFRGSYLEVSGRRAFLTERGFLVSNLILSDLLRRSRRDTGPG